MRKLLSLITFCCVMAISACASLSSANAAPLTNAVHSLKVEQTSVVEKAYYHRYRRGYYHRGYHHRRYYGGYYHRGYYGYGNYHRRCWWHNGYRHCRRWY
jgi:opacity protein-like surface antigen